MVEDEVAQGPNVGGVEAASAVEEDNPVLPEQVRYVAVGEGGGLFGRDEIGVHGRTGHDGDADALRNVIEDEREMGGGHDNVHFVR